MSIESRALSSLTTLSTAKKVNCAPAWAAAVFDVAMAYANNGGTKPRIEATRAALYDVKKKDVVYPTGTAAAVIIDALAYILETAAQQGARPAEGLTVEDRTAAATPYAQQVADLLRHGLAMVESMRKAQRELKKLKDAAETAAAVAPITEASSASADTVLSPQVMIDRLSAAMDANPDIIKDVCALPPVMRAAQARAELHASQVSEALTRQVFELRQQLATVQALADSLAAENAALSLGLKDAHAVATGKPAAGKRSSKKASSDAPVALAA